MQTKEVAERKAREITNNVEQLTTELQRKKHNSNTAMDMAKKASKESASKKRTIHSLGCRVHLSNNGVCALDFSSFPRDTQQRFSSSPSQRNSDGNNGQFDEKSYLSVPISVMSDVANPNCPVKTFAHYDQERVTALGRVLDVRNLEANILDLKQTLKHLINFQFTTLTLGPD